MNQFPQLTESLIRQNTTTESFKRGENYYRQGAVLKVIRRGNLVQSYVEGSEYEPYEVQITLDDRGVAVATCSCPYDWGGWCKHIVAVLLTCIRDPASVEERLSLKDLLSPLTREQLQDLVLHLVEAMPSLIEDVEEWVEEQVPFSGSVSETAPVTPQRRTAVDPAAYQRKVRSAFRSLSRMRPSEAYWHIGEVVDQVRGILDEAWKFIEAGDGLNALAVLEGITAGYVEEWTSLDDSEGDVSAFFEDLGIAWTEALLTADLSREERMAWVRKLEEWREGLEDYGVEEYFDVALAAAEQGWDYPPLVQVLQGEITSRGAWESEDDIPDYADQLAIARLNVLERQGRFQEYLYLAEAESQTDHYVRMLVRLGRVEEAVNYGLQYLFTTDEALSLARALHEHGHPVQALRIAEHGLSLQGSRYALAQWLAETAAAMGDLRRALEATRAAFHEYPSLSTYLRARELSGERWPEVRTDLLARLAQAASPAEQVEIYLHEGMVDEAIRVVDTSGYVGHAVVERVVDAVLRSHPDWAIRQCRRQAEHIMDGGKSQYYAQAGEWLSRAREAYRVAGREAEWRAYLQELMERHKRKYSLMPILERLGKEK